MLFDVRSRDYVVCAYDINPLPFFFFLQHMVQNQINPNYPAFSQAGIEEYQQAGAIPAQATAGVAVADPTQPQFKPDPTSTAVAVTTNGVEQQTVSIPAVSSTNLRPNLSVKESHLFHLQKKTRWKIYTKFSI